MLYDETWASGKVDSIFHKEYDSKWNNIDPQEMIKTHMPFDPVWQLLSEPINYEQFKYSTFKSVNKKKVEYNKLIDIYLSKSISSRSIESLERSTKMKTENLLVLRWRSRLKNKIGVFNNLSFKEQLDATLESINEKHLQIDEFLIEKEAVFPSDKWTPKYSQDFYFSIKNYCEVKNKFTESTI